MRDSFIFYRSFLEAINDLDEEDQFKAIMNIIRYALDGDIPEEKGVARAIFSMAKPQIDANAKRKEGGNKGGRPSKKPMVSENAETEKPMVSENAETEKPNVNDNVNVNDNDNVNVNDNDNDTANAVKEKGAKAPKKKKHRYGEYQHVLLTDDERDRLMDEFGDIRANKAITYLDEYIQMKGYKAKDHYLAIRKWVFDALDREERQKARSGTTQRSQFEDLMEQIRRDEYDG